MSTLGIDDELPPPTILSVKKFDSGPPEDYYADNQLVTQEFYDKIIIILIKITKYNSKAHVMSCHDS